MLLSAELTAATARAFAIAERLTAESFFVVDGVFFLTNLDGSARRACGGPPSRLPRELVARRRPIERPLPLIQQREVLLHRLLVEQAEVDLTSVKP